MLDYLAESIKYRVEIYEYLTLGYLGNVVKTLGREVSDPILRVGEARKNRFDEFVHVGCNVNSECDSGAGETN